MDGQVFPSLSSLREKRFPGQQGGTGRVRTGQSLRKCSGHPVVSEVR
ncbi:MAG: hypothetical protein ACWGPR_10330 [Candidatus Deferrimicrobiaceae bacterium]